MGHESIPRARPLNSPVDIPFADLHPALSTCAKCGAVRPPKTAACPHCEVQLMEVLEAPKTLPRTVGIGTLMVTIAAVALAFAIIRAVPEIGVFLLMIFMLGLLRTYRGLAVSAAIDWPLTFAEKLSLGAESMAVAFLLLGGTAITFVAAAIPLGGLFIALGGPLGAIPTVILAALPTIYVVRKMRHNLWPVRLH